MGRHGSDPADYHKGRLYARHCGGDGSYDRGGAYWGARLDPTMAVYAVWTRGGEFCAYIDARSCQDAIDRICRLSTLAKPELPSDITP